MDQNLRIEQAWRKTRDWITQFDGAPTETYLTNVDAATLPQAVQALSVQTADLRIAVIAGKGGEESQDVPLDRLPESLARLQSGKLAGLSVNAVARPGDLDLDLHIVIHTLGNRKVDLEVVWWADQAFPEDVSAPERIRSLVAYFIELQALFGAAKVYVGPEAYEKPGPGSESWVEI
jgi:hypothetical protein